MSEGAAVADGIAYRRLSLAFSVRCDDPHVARYIDRVLARSRVAQPGPAALAYEVIDAGPSAEDSRFRLLRDGAWMVGGEDLPTILEDLFARVNLDTVNASDDRVLIHSGAVTTRDGVGVLLPAPAGSGKSTLVAGLVRSGFGYLSDEAAVLQPETARVEPYPIHLSLKGASRDRFPEARPAAEDRAYLGSTWFIDPDAIRPGSVGHPSEMGFVIAHRFAPDASLSIEPLTPAEACVELVQNLMLARRDTPRALDLLARVCRGSTSVRLAYGNLDDAVAAIEGLTR